MALRYFLIKIIFILLTAIAAFKAAAQPTLPDIAGAEDKGIVILSWNCQYSGIKSITVLRSADSVNSYTPIGKVKKLDKGVQAFVDGHPAPGKNYYRLIILFKSALTWSSNHCSVTIARAEIEKSKLHLPPNDSLQRYIVTGDTVKPGKANTVAEQPAKPVVKDILSVEPEDDPEPPTKTKIPVTDSDDNEPVKTEKPEEPKRKVYISFDLDTMINAAPRPRAEQDKTPVEHKRVTISFDDPTETTPTFIRSLYVYTDTVTGHVDLNLPNDIASHHYSIKFYDSDNHMIIEVPRITASKIIMDKRNFQRKGTYKFVLRKDVTELESGYIEIKQ